MDNEYGHSNGENHVVEPQSETPAPDASNVIEQVRELLFGEHRRVTEGSLKGLEDKLAALTATIESRFADLERRLSETRAEHETARDSNVAAIGSALMDLGERIKSLIPKPQP